MSKKKIIIYLIIISSISLGLKLYTVDFSLPVYSDNLDYTLNAIAYSNGDFKQSFHRASGWPIFISTFFHFVNSDDFIVYSNIVRILSLSVSLITIPIVYLLARKFFEKKYSLVAASLFAFEPHLNYNAGLGLSEPLFNLVIVVSVYFLLNNNTKFIIPSLLFVGFAWWIRLNGVLLLIVITLIYFITMKKSNNLIRNYGIGIIIFLIIISPVLIQRYDQFGDPFYNWFNDKIFAGSYEKLLAENTQNENPTVLNYIEKNGILSFVNIFIINGMANIFKILANLSLPYLFILIPFGILFSFRAFHQNSKLIKANWIFILFSLGFMVIAISAVPEKRFLYFIFPFLIIFSTIPIQRVTEYGLSTFSFSNKQKNTFLVIIIIIVIILSCLFTLRFEKLDLILEHEKIEFAKFILENLNGKINREFVGSTNYIIYVMVTEKPENFKNYKIDSVSGNTIFIYGQTVEEVILNGEKYGLKYLISNEGKSPLNPFIDDIYYKENQYQYLNKVFDSTEYGFQKLRVKVFEIDYKKFHKYLN